MYWEPCIERRDCHYRTSPIGYWDKGSTVGWYKVLGFLYNIKSIIGTNQYRGNYNQLSRMEWELVGRSLSEI